MRSRAVRAGLVVALVTLLAPTAGCAADTGAEPSSATGAEVLTPSSEYVVRQLGARSSAGKAIWYDQTLLERLPNRRFSVDGGPAEPLGAGVAVGTVTAVVPGRAYVMDSEDDVGGREVPFETGGAGWRIVAATVSTTDAWGLPEHEDVSFGLTLDGNVDWRQAMTGLRELGRIVVALGDQGDYPFDPGLFRVARSGAVLGPVSRSGRIELPLLEDFQRTDYLKGAQTVRELARASRQPDSTIRIVDFRRVG